MARKYWIGFDLGGTKMLAVVFNEAFKPVGRERAKTRGFEGQSAGMARLCDTVRGALKDAGISSRDLRGIGIACPGPLDPDRGVLLDLPNLNWHNVPIRRMVTRAFNVHTAVCNDVDAGVYGEYRFGSARGARCALGVFPGTGIGGGCVLDGEIVRGTHRSCLEIGHLPMLPDGPLCGCGQRGCLEALASRLAISAAAAAAAYRGEAPALFKSAGSDLSTIRSSTLAKSIRDGDRAVERIVRDAAVWLGRGIGAAVNLLCPDVVVLGGGLVEAMPQLYLDETTRAARRTCMPAFADQFKVRVARLGDDAAALGAACWAARELSGK